jgi:benzoate 4-monooxygenase
MANIINARIQSGERRNDILQILLDTQESEDPEDRLSDIALMNEAVMFLIAGSAPFL